MVYEKNLRPKSRDARVSICAEEVVSSEQVYFHVTFLCCCL